MKKFALAAVAALLLAGASTFLVGTAVLSSPLEAQETQAKPHKVGLIDMAYIFKNYKKFEALREDLKTEIEKADQEAQARAAQVTKLQEEMKNSPYKPGSPEYTKLEDQITRQVTDFETFRKKSQMQFLRQEADIYKTIYLEVSEAVGLYAQHYKYTLVLRFNAEEVKDAADPKEILNSMNRQVVFHRGEDDITKAVLNYLNQRYSPQAAGGAPSGTGAGAARRQ
ncbi:MAG: OmpH family outer membrane protein [Planctomycetes bacterium]|nr:OmpH family outer membrane protein [Planctomycetota bacterium]